MCSLDVVDLDDVSSDSPSGMPNPRWRPDLQLVPAIIATPRWPRPLTDYDHPDQCWIVAGLDLAGWSAPEIVHRVGGSKRLVIGRRGEPLTELCKLMQQEVNRLTDELRLEKIGHCATEHELAQANRTASRLRIQLDQVLDAHRTGEVEKFRCGCPKVRYNVYEHRGRKYCRTCRTDRETRRRHGLRAV